MNIEAIAGLVVVVGYPLAIIFESKHTIPQKIISIISGEMVFIFGCNLLALDLPRWIQTICLMVGCAGIVFLHVSNKRRRQAPHGGDAEQ